MLGTSANVASSIFPSGGGWYRFSMTLTSAIGMSFVVYLTSAANVIRAQGNATSGAIFLCFPQMKLGPIATAYIPRKVNSATRSADVILNDVSMSIFRFYGERDFFGPIGRRGLLGADGAPGPFGPQGLAGPIGLQGPARATVPAGATGLQGPTGPMGLAGPTGAASTVTGPQGLAGPT